MIASNRNRIRKIFIPGAFFFLASIAVSIHSMAAEILLTPPGLRPVRDPSLVIPADYNYANRSMTLLAYRDASGNPTSGWSVKFFATRRFASDRNARIFFRNSDLRQSESKVIVGHQGAFRFWPVGTRMIIEIYEGNALQKENDKLIGSCHGFISRALCSSLFSTHFFRRFTAPWARKYRRVKVLVLPGSGPISQPVWDLVWFIWFWCVGSNSGRCGNHHLGGTDCCHFWSVCKSSASPPLRC